MNPMNQAQNYAVRKLRRKINNQLLVSKNRKNIPKRMRKNIKKVILSLAESKNASYFSSVIQVGNAINATSFPNGTILLTPNTLLTVAQGTGESGRIGNRIKVSKCTLNMTVFPEPYTAVTNTVPIPQCYEIFIWSFKGQYSSTLAYAQSTVSNATGTFFQANNTYTGFGGNSSDTMRMVNSDTISLYFHKRFKLSASVLSSNTGNQANFYNYANNDFKLLQLHKIDLMKHGFPPSIVWNDTNPLAESRQLFMTISPWDCDGGAALDTTNAIPINFTYALTMEYKDF